MQGHKVKMCKKEFRIGDLAKKLKVKKFVIRFWEKEFGFKSHRSEGGQRFYTQEDFCMFNRIKDLLYGQGFTIAGAIKQLSGQSGQKQKNIDFVDAGEIKDSSKDVVSMDKNIIAAKKELLVDVHKQEKFLKKLKSFKKELIQFKSVLDQ